MDDRAIGVFDSGLGGLTVLQALADLLPHEHLVYLGDTARYPYGPLDTATLQRYALEIADVLLDHGVKMIVVACNSATAAALDLLRERLHVPVVGVVEPGLRAATTTTRTGRVGVIGTEVTASSGIYERTAARLRLDLDLVVLACPGLVELVEAGDTDGDHVRVVVADRLAPLGGSGIDALVLGCTHYPLLARPLKDVVGRDVTLVSSADETAFEVRDLLRRTGWGRRGSGPGTHRFVTTGSVERFRALGGRFLGRSLAHVAAHRWPAAASVGARPSS